MPYPALVIDRKKLKSNVENIMKLSAENGVQICCVTKVYCAIPEIVDVLYEAGMRSFADSRIQNLKKISYVDISRMLLRIPMISEAAEVVRYSDVSLNSELATMRALSDEAVKLGKIHKVVLMVDVGDLREGVLSDEAAAYAGDILKLPGVELIGVGTNLNCYGGIIPTPENLTELCDVAEKIESTYDVKLQIVSGGNSGSVYLMDVFDKKADKKTDKKLPPRVNHLRLGEVVLLGRETSYQGQVPGLLDAGVFTLKAEIVELKEKPSYPRGEMGLNAFGEKPVYIDKGIMKRAIAAIGRQDLAAGELTPLDEDIEILGSSSDHLILDVTHSKNNYAIGDVLSFSVNYGALLGVATSEYVAKIVE